MGRESRFWRVHVRRVGVEEGQLRVRGGGVAGVTVVFMA